jgi:hypothetical protein
MKIRSKQMPPYLAAEDTCCRVEALPSWVTAECERHDWHWASVPSIPGPSVRDLPNDLSAWRPFEQALAPKSGAGARDLGSS